MTEIVSCYESLIPPVKPRKKPTVRGTFYIPRRTRCNFDQLGLKPKPDKQTILKPRKRRPVI
jgi:hypothetical protein